MNETHHDERLLYVSRYQFVPRPLGAAHKPLSPLPANVYADWLDDHGEPEAAKKLREAFPLVDSDT